MNALISYDDAVQYLLQATPLNQVETVPLLEGLGRVTADAIVAPRAQPPAALSAMDGYALRHEDANAAGAVLTVVGEIPAGGQYDTQLKAGQAVRIFTGAPVPNGANGVIMQENVARKNNLITITHPLTDSTNVRPAAMDFAKGDDLVGAGETLTAIKIALAAAANNNSVSVKSRPKITIMSSGDELVEPGGDLNPGAIINSAAYGIGALATSWGGTPILTSILPDKLDAAIALIKPQLSHTDVIVTVGGASVGDYDIVKPAFKSFGAQMIFEKVAVKPGKPCWHARIPDGPLILGLPGNPASASVCAHLFLQPLLATLLGRKNSLLPKVTAQLASDLPANGSRENFLRGHGKIENGVLWVSPDSRQDSSLLTPFGKANVLIRQTPNLTAQTKGAMIEALIIGNIKA